MSDPSANPLSRTKIRQLLTAVGSAPARDESLPHIAEYDWRDPHYFNEDQLNRLAAIMSQVAARIAGTFTRFYSREFNVSPMSINQHYADDLPHHMAIDRAYCLTFGPEKGQSCGCMAVPMDTAMGWVMRLLGDSEPDGDPERPLSPLEESLLFDLVTAVLEGFLTPLQPHHHLKPDDQLSKGQADLQFDRTEAVCRIVFQVRNADETSDVAFALPCSHLAPLVGKNTTTSAKSSPQESRSKLAEHLQEMPVMVTARLGSTTLSFQEMADLAPGDILLLEKPVDGLVDVVVDDHVLCLGLVARSENKYAVSVTESRTATRPAGSRESQ